MSDSRYNRYQQVARRHAAITPHDSNNLPELSVVVALTTGNAVVVDQFDTALTYTGVPAGYIFPVLVKRVNATDTTATVARLVT